MRTMALRLRKCSFSFPPSHKPLQLNYRSSRGGEYSQFFRAQKTNGPYRKRARAVAKKAAPKKTVGKTTAPKKANVTSKKASTKKGAAAKAKAAAEIKVCLHGVEKNERLRD